MAYSTLINASILFSILILVFTFGHFDRPKLQDVQIILLSACNVENSRVCYKLILNYKVCTLMFNSY